MSTPSSTNAVSPAGSASPDLGDVSGASSAAFSSVGNDLIAELTDQNSREGLNLSTRHDPSTASTAERHIPATHPDDEDAISSDVGTRVQTRACEIEEELSRYCVETANRIPVNARHFIMARVFELVKLCSDLRADAAAERGAASCLGGDKDDHRGASEAVILPEAVQTSQARPGFPAGPPGALLSSSVPPTAAMTYAAALQAAHDIRDVTLRQTRYGLTVLAHSRDTLTNMRQAIADNAITCAVLSMRIPEKRNPHVRFSGVDPDITSEEFISRVAERNTHLQLDTDKCKVRASFKERSGTSAFIVEVDPDAFARIMRQPRLSVGWTSVRVTEDLHVATCTFCATYGHGRSSCPLRSEPARAVCTRCGTEGHLGTACTVRLGESAVCCAECRRAGLQSEGHPTGFPQCPCFLTELRDFGQEPIMAARNRGSPAVRGDNRGTVCVNFIQLNLDHAKRAFANLPKLMEGRDVRVAAVSDPYRPSRRIPALPHGYLVYAVDQDPGAAIITRNPPYDVCPVHVSSNVVAIFCEAEDFAFVFVSVYAPPHDSLDPTLDELRAVLSTARSPNVIVAGDFNAKHRLWGQTDADERGLQVAQFALSSNLVVMNDDQSLPTFETLYSASWLDLTLATPPVLASGFEWSVLEDTTFSEHRLVQVCVGGAPPPGKRLTNYAHHQLLDALRKDRWFFQVSGADIKSSDALDRVLHAFTLRYDTLYRRHLRPVRTRPTSKPWFTPELNVERLAVTAKRRRFQRTRDVQMRAIFRRDYTTALAAYRQHIREARDAHLRGYALSSVHEYLFSKPFKEAFGRLRQFRCLPSLLGSDGTVTSTHLESAALLLRTQIAVDDPTTDDAVHIPTRALASLPYATFAQDVPFTYSEVVDVLRNTPNKSAPGPDNISPVIMKALFQFHPRFFMMAFNAALALGYFPRCWRTVRVTFIHKPGRPAERTSSYRPICVSSVFGKTLERLLNGRLQHHLARHALIHPRQYGFTRGRSSLLALHHLKEHLVRLKTQRMPAILMSLDFHGAFDSVWHPLVLRYFRERALPSGLYHLLRTFLEERSVFVQSHAGRVDTHPTLGSPQGSPLSPLLWNVVIDSLLSLHMPPGVVVQAYADDTIILVPAPTRSALGDLASEVLRRVVSWSRTVKVTLNCDKTFCVLFSHGVGGMERVHPTVRLGPAEPSLTFKESLRVLGVIFDRRLTFFHHAEYLRNKVATLASRVATFLAMQRSCVRPAHKVLLYRQVLLPALTYASPVWWGECHVDCRLYARMVTIQRVVLLALTRAYHTTSTAALQVLMQAPPIDLELERINIEFRLFTLRQYVAFGSLRYCPDWVANPHSAKATHPAAPAIVPFARLTSAQARAATRARAVHVYTDGSFTSNAAGAAYAIFAPPDRVLSVGRYRLLRATSAYSAEVVAFREALKHLIAARYFEPVAIYTDCLSLLQALASPRNVEPHVLEIRALVRKLSRMVHVYLYHVPGHAGVFGNEVADFIAERASHRSIDTSLPLPFRAVRSQLRRELLVLWTARWREDHSHTELFRWITDLRTLPPYLPPPPSLVTLLTGHGRFPHYFVRFNLMRAPRCPCGSYSVDMSHILHTCSITTPYTSRIAPQDTYRNMNYSHVLACPRNRPLLIGAGPYRWGPLVPVGVATQRFIEFYMSGPVRPYWFVLALTASRQLLRVLCPFDAASSHLAGVGHMALRDTSPPGDPSSTAFPTKFGDCFRTLRPSRACVRPAQKVLLYRQVILPALTYGSPVWWGESHVDCRLRVRILMIQRVALLALTRAYKTTSTAALQVIMHAPPIDLELERLNAEFRLFTLRKHVAFGSLRFRPDWVAQPHTTLLIHPSLPAAVPFARHTREQTRAASHTRAVHVYTDGSFTTISAGAAFVVFAWPDKVLATGRFKLHRATSAYSAEVVAFREAHQHLLAASYMAPVAIYTDCLSLLQALASPRNVEPHIMAIRSLIRKLSRHVRVYVYHVPGHSGVFGNEVADYMEERASRAGHQRTLPLPFRAVRSQLRRELHVLWAIRWREEYKHTELFRWTTDVAVEAALRLLGEKDQVRCRRFLCVCWAPGQKTCRYEVPRALTLDQVPPMDVGLPNVDVRPGQRVFSAPASGSVCSVDVASALGHLITAAILDCPRNRALLICAACETHPYTLLTPCTPRGSLCGHGHQRAILRSGQAVLVCCLASAGGHTCGTNAESSDGTGVSTAPAKKTTRNSTITKIVGQAEILRDLFLSPPPPQALRRWFQKSASWSWRACVLLFRAAADSGDNRWDDLLRPTLRAGISRRLRWGLPNALYTQYQPRAGSLRNGQELRPCPYVAQNVHVETCKSSETRTEVQPTEMRCCIMMRLNASGSTSAMTADVPERSRNDALTLQVCGSSYSCGLRSRTRSMNSPWEMSGSTPEKRT
ncbi:hypothetical protein HPB52_023739 [Rhipicephalus sanguineus]|uniref:Reverse transcriptase n=1 Tax=Rhipicephalus sanguineus TaxID=34632 RepID=A0A9D4Q681_RHISA|nr:hypothetical protein HPB52_023739 [Rhipicephalus sanguineus]